MSPSFSLYADVPMRVTSSDLDRYGNPERANHIIQMIEARRSSQSPLLQEMLEVQKRYDGNVVVVPMPDVEGSPTLPKTTPLLIANAIDNIALRAASVQPMIRTPALDPRKEHGIRSKDKARDRQRALHATWRKSHLNILSRRALRQLTGYATYCMTVVPTEYGPCIELREPLAAYPDPKAPEDLSPPKDVAFLYDKSASWIKATFPETAQRNGGPIPDTPTTGYDDMWTMFEWIDANQVVVGLLSPKHETAGQFETRTGARCWRILSWDQNLLGYAPVVIPRRASMSKIASQISQMTGLADLMDKLMALDIAAQEKAIFPDRYVISAQGDQAKLLGGRWKDGREGETNILMDAEQVGQLVSTPSQGTALMYDRMERNFNISAKQAPQMQGETYGALRTGRGIQELAAIAVDPHIQEIHEIHEAALTYLNRAVADTYTAYYPSRKFTMLSGSQADISMVEFVPEEIFETNENVVNYAIPGADANQLTVALGQLVSAEMISRNTARQLHPYVGDPEAERVSVLSENLDQALLQGVIKSVVTSQEPGMSPAMMWVAELVQLIEGGMDMSHATQAAWRRAQEEQARLAELEMENAGGPGMVLPEAMPGLAGAPTPGGVPVGAPVGPPPGPVPTPPPGQGLPALLSALGSQGGPV